MRNLVDEQMNECDLYADVTATIRELLDRGVTIRTVIKIRPSTAAQRTR